MGQMTFALMFGAPLPEAPKGKTWWGNSVEKEGKWVHQAGLLELFKPGRGGLTPRTDENSEIIGFLVAVGASGARGVPRLEGPLELTGVERENHYGAACAKAREAWLRFESFLREQGVRVGRGSLYLVEIEVS